MHQIFMIFLMPHNLLNITEVWNERLFYPAE
ncbi:MAG: hypothetical protein H6Q18_496 [Bacteroidetes bacterium]|nr:hypothetical protein [Bacteroidota bacterium]